MERTEIVFAEVSRLYASAKTSMGNWMWQNHTQWVAKKAHELAKKYGADIEIAYCAALLHDLGDSHYERNHEDFEEWSRRISKELLEKAGFHQLERDAVLEAIRTHSCRPGNLPKTMEGKVLATADGLWHLQTNFFPIICYMHRPDNTHTYKEWQEWFTTKIERDFGSKIFFEDEKEETREDYNALKRIFENKTLQA